MKKAEKQAKSMVSTPDAKGQSKIQENGKQPEKRINIFDSDVDQGKGDEKVDKMKAMGILIITRTPSKATTGQNRPARSRSPAKRRRITRNKATLRKIVKSNSATARRSVELMPGADRPL